MLGHIVRKFRSQFSTKVLLTFMVMLLILPVGCEYGTAGAPVSDGWIGNFESPYQGMVADHFYSSTLYGFKPEVGQAVFCRIVSGQELTSDNYTNLLFEKIYDNQGILGADNATMTAPAEGLYLITITLEIDSSATVTTFYPDAHPESLTVDGTTGRDIHSTWADIHDGAGTYAYDSWPMAYACYEYSGASSSNWYCIYRSAALFDTSPMSGATPTAAVVRVYGASKFDNLGIAPTVNIYSTNPTTDTAVGTGDYIYTKWGAAQYCDTSIAYADWNLSGYNEFELNAAGLAAINPSGITKIGFRDNYDVANTKPTGVPNLSGTMMTFYTSENVTYKPELVVTYGGGMAGDSEIGLYLKKNGASYVAYAQNNGSDLLQFSGLVYLYTGDELKLDVFTDGAGLETGSTANVTSYIGMSRVGR